MAAPAPPFGSARRKLTVHRWPSIGRRTDRRHGSILRPAFLVGVVFFSLLDRQGRVYHFSGNRLLFPVTAETKNSDAFHRMRGYEPNSDLSIFSRSFKSAVLWCLIRALLWMPWKRKAALHFEDTIATLVFYGIRKWVRGYQNEIQAWRLINEAETERYLYFSSVYFPHRFSACPNKTLMKICKLFIAFYSTPTWCGSAT